MSAPKPDCEFCGGTGMVETEPNPPHPPVFDRCRCVLKLDVLANVERIAPGLSQEAAIASSPLLGKEDEDIWITAGHEFLPHLRHVALRQPTMWACRVVSDAELTTAWLASIALQGKDILDADAYKVSTRALTLPDLVVPPHLLVIKMGVKVARNSAASEVLAEAINIRRHEGVPTWLWDEPTNPVQPGHMFWSDRLGLILRRWEHLKELTRPEQGPGVKKKPGSSSGMGGRKTLRGGGS